MSKNTRIFLACAFGVGLVTSAFFFAPASNQGASAASKDVIVVPAPARTYIAIEDADADGIPNWQEAYDDTAFRESLASSTYEVPDTFTGKFSIDYVEHLMRSNMYGAYGASHEEILQWAEEQFLQAATDELYTATDIIMSSDIKEPALRTYGNQVASIALRYPIPEGTRETLVIFDDAIATESEIVLAELDPVIAAYQNMRDDMLALSVPLTYQKEHLDLINVYHALFMDLTALRSGIEDPFYSLVRLERYDEDIEGLAFAISNLYVKLHELGDVRWTANDTASSFITVTS